MRKYFATLALLLIPSFAYCSDFSIITFAAYSNAIQKECTVYGGAFGRSKDGAMRAGALDITKAYYRYINLGTKGFGNYSAVAIGAKVISFICTNVTGTPIYAKMYFDGMEASHIPVSIGTINIRE